MKHPILPGSLLLLAAVAFGQDGEIAKELVEPPTPVSSNAIADSVARAPVAIASAPAQAADSSDTAADEDTDGWQDWTATLGVSAQQPRIKAAGGDTLQRGASLTFGRDWTSGTWTIGPEIGLDGTKTQYPSADSTRTDASFSLGLDWSPSDWFTSSVTPFYTLQTGPDDIGATGSLKGTYAANEHLSFRLGLAATWSHLQHGSAFVEPGIRATSSWLDAGAELDLGTQWESYSRLVDSSRVVIRKAVPKDTIVQVVHMDSGEVPLLQASAYLKLHQKSWSVKPYWKFQAWQKSTQDTTFKGSKAQLTQHQFTTEFGLASTVSPNSWLDLDMDLSHGTQTGTTILNGRTLTQKSNPRLAKNYPWLRTASLPTGWSLALSATTTW